MELKELYKNLQDKCHTLMSQRCTTFNYFLIISALFVNALILAIRENLFFIAITIGVLQCFISILFSLLEKRNTRYYQKQNELLREYEAKIKASNDELKDINMPNQYAKLENVKKGTIGYAKFFQCIYLMFAGIGFAFITLSILQLCGVVL